MIENYPIEIFGKHEILVDIYCENDSVPNRPCIIFLHGGGFVGGDKSQFANMADRLSRSLKAVCISINYRLASEAPFPAAVIDCLGVCEWVGKNKCRLDTDNTYLVGGSPGANIAAMAMVQGGAILRKAKAEMNVPVPVQGILLNPILDMEDFYLKNLEERKRIDLYTGGDDVALRGKTSPILYPRSGLSFFILQGTKDKIVSVAVAKKMQKLFEQSGSRVGISDFLNEPHGWFNQTEKVADVVHEIEAYICKEERRGIYGTGEAGRAVCRCNAK